MWEQFKDLSVLDERLNPLLQVIKLTQAFLYYFLFLAKYS